MGSRLFQSTDVGAPILNGLVKPNHTLIALLKAVLVDGYGDTAPLGYTLEFEDFDNHIAVFRQPEGSRQYLRFDCSGAGNYPKFISYETMTSAHEGISPCPLLSETTYNYVYISSYATSAEKPWKIIGDSKGFYFIPWSDYTGVDTLALNNNQFIWFGDYMPFTQESKDIFCCSLSRATGQGLFLPSVSAICQSFHASRYTSREKYCRKLGVFTNTSQQLIFGEGSFYRPPGNTLMFSIPWIFEALSAENGDITPWNNLQYGMYPVGMLPGLQNIVGNLWGYSAAELIQLTKPYFVTENGENKYFIFCSKNGNHFSEGSFNRYCIRLGEDFRNV